MSQFSELSEAKVLPCGLTQNSKQTSQRKERQSLTHMCSTPAATSEPLSLGRLQRFQSKPKTLKTPKAGHRQKSHTAWTSTHQEGPLGSQPGIREQGTAEKHLQGQSGQWCETHCLCQGASQIQACVSTHTQNTHAQPGSPMNVQRLNRQTHSTHTTDTHARSLS